MFGLNFGHFFRKQRTKIWKFKINYIKINFTVASMIKCSNCNKWFRDTYKLRRHYLCYLPYYFGTYICIICEKSFETELKLLNHIIRQKHSSNPIKTFDVKSNRQTFFETENNKYFGTSQVQFEQKDVKYFLNSKGVTNWDVKNTVDKLLISDEPKDVEPAKMDFNTRIVTPNLYDSINSNPATSPFEASALNSETETNLFPNPPTSKSSVKRKFSIAPTSTQTYQENEQFVNLDRRLQRIEIRLDNLEQSIQSAKDEITLKIDQNMQYEQQLFNVLQNQLRAGIRDTFASMLQGALTSTRSSNN
ncbi:MAG: hypothetical protein KZQ70_13360 [gamma proteobacterium symbiont of Lucinoma myriamae]|nr:hypothetical protein [gamma proteobacterium symbiont of Lucinoma myriamae]